MRSLL
ncbi:hypothetical protein D030_3924A, partial [Vibrio parahaemolyticus AQ3810]